MTFRSLMVAATIMLGTVSGLIAQSHTFSDNQGNFSVVVPADMDKSTADSGTPGAPWTAFVGVKDGVAYFVQYKDAVERSGAEAELDFARDGFVSQGLHLVNERSIRLNGSYPGRSLSVENPQNGTVGTVNMYIANGRLYLVGAVHPTGAGEDAANSFLNSFTLLN